MRRSIAFAGADLWESIECRGYVSLAQNPEICTAVDTIARLIESMTIHLMENTEAGDIRVKNELSRKVDISPNNNMTRAAFIHWIVKTLMLEGNGNAVVWPETRRGILRDLKPVPPAFTSFVPDGMWDYRVVIAGQEYDPFLSTPSGWRATAKTDKVFICFCAKGRRICLFKTRKEKNLPVAF